MRDDLKADLVLDALGMALGAASKQHDRWKRLAPEVVAESVSAETRTAPFRRERVPKISGSLAACILYSQT